MSGSRLLAINPNMALRSHEPTPSPICLNHDVWIEASNLANLCPKERPMHPHNPNIEQVNRLTLAASQIARSKGGLISSQESPILRWLAGKSSYGKEGELPRTDTKDVHC